MGKHVSSQDNKSRRNRTRQVRLGKRYFVYSPPRLTLRKKDSNGAKNVTNKMQSPSLKLHREYLGLPSQYDQALNIPLTVPWCNNEMHASYVPRIRAVSNADGLYGAYDPSPVLNGPKQCSSIRYAPLPSQKKTLFAIIHRPQLGRSVCNVLQNEATTAHGKVYKNKTISSFRARDCVRDEAIKRCHFRTRFAFWCPCFRLNC